MPNPDRFFSVSNWEMPALPISDLRYGGGKHFERATIAHNLVEECEKHVHSTSKISIVGNDLPNVADESYPWATKTLPKWLRMGVAIRYFAIAPSAKALENLTNLSAQSFAGKLQVRRPKSSIEAESSEGKLLKQWRSYHFVVFERDPQFWVELNHPANQKEAYDCYYFSPDLAAQMPLYHLSSEQFNHMFEKFSENLIGD